MSNIGDYETVIFNSERLIDEFAEKDNVRGVKSKTHRQTMAALDRCDIVVTLDNPFLTFAKTLKKHIVLIQGPRDATYKLGTYDNYSVITKKEMFECMPCWIGPGEKCGVTQSEESACMKHVNAVEVFGKIMKQLKLKDKESVTVG